MYKETCIKSNDFSLYPEIIKKARSDGNSYDITEFIMHARTSVREQMLDTEYALSLARARSIEELQSLLSSPNLIDVGS